MLTVENLSIQFNNHHHSFKAVDDISFQINPNEVVGLVGESGSGKSVTALSMLNLLSPEARLSGKIIYQGRDILTLPPRDLRQIRGRQIGLIFQNPLAALNPVFTIGNQMIETIRLHQNVTKKEAREIAIDLLSRVNIPDADKRIDSYPHQFSIGMCQRVVIALTLAMRPKLLIADEPTASLDVTVQAQILALLDELRTEYQMAVLLISHDLGVIAQHSDRVLIMYLGKMMETGPTEEVFRSPRHPYTQALLAAIPNTTPGQKHTKVYLKGDIPSAINLPTGCRFHPRCPQAQPQCQQSDPPPNPKGKTTASCFYA